MFKINKLAILISLLALVSCSLDPMNSGDQYNTADQDLSGSFETMATGTSNITFGIYTETVPLTVKWDTDTKLDIWNGLTITEQTNYRGDGTKAWKLTGTGTWIGMGIRVNPLTTLKSMSAFSNGYLRFMYKGTKRFKIGIKSGGTSPVEKWLAMTNGKYNFYTNNSWRTITIPLSVFTGVNLAKIEQYFMLSADSTLGYTAGSVYYIDNIYWYKTVTYTIPSSSSSSSVSSPSSSSSKSSSSSSVASSSSKSSSSSSVVSSSSSSSGSIDTNKALVLYSDTLKQNVTWGTDINTNQSPSTPNVISFETNTAGEGKNSMKIKVNSNMFNVNLLRYPLVTYLDLTAYTNGSLRFMVKATKYLSVSIHMVENYDIMVHLTNDGMYGFRTNNTWCSVVIPMSEYVKKGLDFSRLYGWLKFYGGYYEGVAGGEEYYLDNIYFYK